MTTKQSDLLATKPETKKALAVLQKFGEFESQYKAMVKQEKEAREMILNAMIDNDVTELPTPFGSITRGKPKTTYSALDLNVVDADLTKVVLDTAKVNATVTLSGALPQGITVKETPYIRVNFKKAE